MIPKERRLRLRRIRLIFIVMLGVSWFMLGLESDNVPWFDDQVWVAMCSIVAGSAFALARWDSPMALRNYVMLASMVGITRSLAYASNSSWGPLWVWLILGTTTVGLYLSLTSDQRNTRRFRG